MTENLIYAVLLAVHNLALVITSGAIIITLFTLHRRNQLAMSWDETHDTALTMDALKNMQLALGAFALVGLTGFGFPIVHIIFHGHTKELSMLAETAFGIKMLGVLMLLAVLLFSQIKFGKRLYPLLQQPAAKKDTQAILFLRKKLLGWIKIAAACIVLILTASAFLNV